MENMDSVDGFSIFLWTVWTLWTPKYAMDSSALEWGANGTPHDRDLKSRSFGISSFSALAENFEGRRFLTCSLRERRGLRKSSRPDHIWGLLTSSPLFIGVFWTILIDYFSPYAIRVQPVLAAEDSIPFSIQLFHKQVVDTCILLYPL